MGNAFTPDILQLELRSALFARSIKAVGYECDLSDARPYSDFLEKCLERKLRYLAINTYDD